MTQLTEAVPNIEKIEGFLAELSEEYDLESRFNRYESMTPELVEMAIEEGMSDASSAIHPLFIADFVITSSEVTSGVTDDDRRKSIIKAFRTGLSSRTEDSKSILEAFYLIQKVYIGLKRNDSFLAGRGIEKANRVLMLLDMYAKPMMVKLQEVLGEGPVNWELGLLRSMVRKDLPDPLVSEYMELDDLMLDDWETFVRIYTVIEEFVTNHEAEVNPDSPLPNIKETAAIYQVSSSDDIHLAKLNISSKITKESVETNGNLQKFLEESDNSNALVFLRGKLLGSQKNLILSRNPFVEGKPLVLFKSPVADINSTEIFQLLELRGKQNRGLARLDNAETINDTYFEMVEKQVTELQDKQIEVDEEYEEEVPVEKKEQKPKKKKRGFFARIKDAIFGSSDDDEEEKDQTTKETKTRKVTKTIQEEVTKTVKEKREKKKRLGMLLDNSTVESLGLFVLEDLRMFEEFDTLRETEYEIIGALESDFDNNSTSVLYTQKFEDSDELFSLLNGLDEVIEAVANYYFDEEHQLIPEEMLFLSGDDKHFILCLDGNEKGLVATLAKTYSKEITNWQNKTKVDSVQRRTLHMRTGQLLSAREHTPFDRAVERIYGDALDTDTEIKVLEEAILSVKS